MRVWSIVAIVIAAIALQATVAIFNINITAINITATVITLLVVVGVVLEPIRVYQAATGRLYENAGAAVPALRKASRLYFWAFPFWLALLWALWNKYVVESCSGENCLSYFIFAIPFPFVYGMAEVFLSAAKSSPSRRAP